MMANNRLFNVFIFIVALILGCGLVSYKVTQSRNEENQHVKYLVKLFSLKGKPDKQLNKYLQQYPSSALRGGDIHDNTYPSRGELFSLLYHSTHSPYQDYKLITEATNISNLYNSHAWIHAEMIQQSVLKLLRGKKPTFIVEVGSFLGSGAIHALAPLVQSNAASGGHEHEGKVDGLVLCVDTWLGDVNMRINPDFDQYTRPRHGTPQLYDLFMSNIVGHALQEVIFPLSMPSVVAARLLGHMQWKIDVIYIDSAHEYGETLVELILYYQLLRMGGVLMGDDYSSFPGVQHAVDTFAAYLGAKPAIVGGQWFLVKTSVIL